MGRITLIFSAEKIQSYQKLLITPLISQLQSLSQITQVHVINYSLIIDLIFTHFQNLGLQKGRNTFKRGKFSSGIEGALASTLNHDFNWKQLSEMILCIFLFDVFKVYLSNIDSETAEI